VRAAKHMAGSTGPRLAHDGRVTLPRGYRALPYSWCLLIAVAPPHFARGVCVNT
jgi:hypothetical protein